MLTTSLLLTKIVLASTVYFQVAPTAADQLAMARFRTADVEFAREAMAEADWIDAEIARDGDIPGWRYREQPENYRAVARANTSFCQLVDNAP